MASIKKALKGTEDKSPVRAACDVIAMSDISVEKERAREKSDIFVRAFGRNLVIR